MTNDQCLIAYVTLKRRHQSGQSKQRQRAADPTQPPIPTTGYKTSLVDWLDDELCGWKKGCGRCMRARRIDDKLAQTAQQHVSYEFMRIRRKCDYIYYLAN